MASFPEFEDSEKDFNDILSRSSNGGTNNAGCPGGTFPVPLNGGIFCSP
jgi:hypothetical protein